MFDLLLHLFSCRHKRTTRPTTPVSKPGEPAGATYVVCLDCGKRIAYDWNEMRMGKAIPQPVTSLAPGLAGTKETKKRAKYISLALAVPVALALRKSLRPKRRGRRGERGASVRNGAGGPET